MTKTHLEQKVEGLKEGMLSRGIGSAYHYRTLRENAPDLFNIVDSNIVPDAREGRGIILVGGAQAHDETVLLARALYFSRVMPVVVPLITLARWLTYDTEELEQLNESQALFVMGFFDNCECPLTRRERTMIEELIGWRIDNGRALFAQAAHTLSGNGWWSESFIERVARATIVRVCGESGASTPTRTH